MPRETCNLKKVKFTRPPAPGIKNLDISDLQQKRKKLRWRAYERQKQKTGRNFEKYAMS